MIIINNILICKAWDNFDGFSSSHKFIEELDTGKYKKAIMWCPQEEEILWGKVMNANVNEVEAALIRNNAHLTVVLGSDGLVEQTYKSLPSQNTDIIYYPTYFANIAALNAVKKTYPTLYSDLPVYPVDKVATTLISKPHNHRSATIDKLCKYGLLENMYYSWNKLTYEEGDRYLYNFKHWKEKIHRLSDKFYEEDFNQATSPPAELFKSAFEIVIETSFKGNFFTEKTFNSILRGRPFLLIGAPGLNDRLTKYGFKNYIDELGLREIENRWMKFKNLCVFDYFEDYSEEIIRKLTAVFDEYKNNPNGLYLSLRDKANYNRKVLQEGVYNLRYIPEEIAKFLHSNNIDPIEVNHPPDSDLTNLKNNHQSSIIYN